MLSEIKSVIQIIVSCVVGLPHRYTAHHSDILKALDIDNASVYNSMISLFKRLCSTDSPTRNMCTHFI